MRRKATSDSQLLYKVTSLLSSTKIKDYSIQEIIASLEISDTRIQEVKVVIDKLIKQGYIIRKKNRYYFIQSDKLSDANATKQSVKLIEGVFDATPLARNYSYAFVKTNEGDFFVTSEDTLNAFHGDVVAIEPHYKNNKTDYCYIRKVIKRASLTLAGDIQKRNERTYFVCSNPKIHQWFEVSDIGVALPGHKVMLEVTNWGNRNLSKLPSGRVTEILGLAGNPETELLAVIRQNNLPLEFPELVIQELDTLNIDIDIEEINKRKDYRDLLTFTIDPSSAKDYDDAISINKFNGGWQLYVHIADVTHYVDINSKLFEEVLSRGNSYYFPRKVIPMLPEKISNSFCSLRQNEDKLTITVYTEFDSQGNIQKQALFESVINSNSRLTYEQVDNLFDGNQTDIEEDISFSLFSARELSNILTEKRVKSGYLFFDLPETEYIYNEQGYVYQMNQSIETDSHKLIENFMLIANQFIAERLTALSPLVMYRVHEIPDMLKIDKLAVLLTSYGLNFNYDTTLNISLQKLLKSFPDEMYHQVFDRIVLRSLKKAKYTIEHLPHFGLAIDTYTHFTSPIRRLCDLVIHYLCKTHITHSMSLNLTKKQMLLYSSIASDKELLADVAEREIEKVMNKIFIKEHLGEVFEGIIISMNSTYIFVRLIMYPIEAVLRVSQLPKGKWHFNDATMQYINRSTSEYYQLMDKLQVQISQVSDEIYLELLKGNSSQIHHYSSLTGGQQIRSRSKNMSRLSNLKKRKNMLKNRSKHEKTNRNF
jgi:ribonuclease R